MATVADIRHRPRRNAAVIVAEPRLTVIEIAVMADPAALEEALGLIVKWAIRARVRDESAILEAPTRNNGVTYGPED